MKQINKVSIYLFKAVLIVNLFLPWMLESTTPDATIGVVIFLMWWFLIFSGVLLWLSFPLSLLATDRLLKWKYGKAFIFSLLSLWSWLQTIFVQWKSINMIDSITTLGTLQIGFYVWIGVLALLCILCLINFMINSNTSIEINSLK